jgi:hypothetical protein
LFHIENYFLVLVVDYHHHYNYLFRYNLKSHYLLYRYHNWRIKSFSFLKYINKTKYTY